MKATLFAILFALLVPSTVFGSSLTVDTGTNTYYGSSATAISYNGSAVYLNDNNEPFIGAALSASVGLWQGGNSVSEMSDTVYGGSWSRNATMEVTAGLCYISTAAARTFDRYEEATGNTTCMPDPPSPNPPPTQIADTDPCSGSGSPCSSPILLDLGSGQYLLSSASDGVLFDIDADGATDRVAWPTSQSVGILFLDRNGNGTPDDGAELFGEHTLRLDGTNAAHGFDALASFDANGDRQISAADPIWSQLRLWFDLYRDGTGGPGEVVTLESKGVTQLGTDAIWNRRRDQHGNVFLWKSLLSRGAASRPYYDVYLRMLPAN